MREELEKKNVSALVPFIVGSLVGAGVAFLLAPKTGKEVRNEIKDVTSRATDSISHSIERGKELYEVNKNAITDAIESGKTAYLQERDLHRKAA
jgi:gas vesicle protein